MEPFPLSSGRPQGGPRIAAALRGKRPPLSQYAMKPPQEALAQLGPAFQVKELELSSFASEPVYMATGARGETRVIRMRGEPLESFDTKRILNVVKSVASVAEARLITQYDAYYLDRRGERPLPVLFVQLNDEARSRYYIDPKTAQVVGSYRSSAGVLGESLAVPRAAFDQLSLAVQLPSGLGHRGFDADAGRDLALRHVCYHRFPVGAP